MSPDADVLVVDDDADVRTSVAEILRQAGYEVEEAGDGAEALVVLSSQHIGAVLLDLRMPRMDGYTMMNALDHPPPILIVSAHHVAEVDRARLVPEVVAVLKKPVAPAKLLDQVAWALAGGSVS